MFYLSTCFISFVFLFFTGVFLFVGGFYFVLNELVYLIEWEIITLNSNSIVMTVCLIGWPWFLWGSSFYFFFSYFV